MLIVLWRDGEIITLFECFARYHDMDAQNQEDKAACGRRLRAAGIKVPGVELLEFQAWRNRRQAERYRRSEFGEGGGD